MSVICFCEHELANLCGEAAKRTGEPVEEFVKAAVDYSIDNSACYNFAYEEDADPCEAVVMKDRVPKEPDGERAELTAKLLRYNLVSNGGRDFVSAASLSACRKLCLAVGQQAPHT